MNKINLHNKSNDYDVGPSAGNYKAILTYKHLITHDFPSSSTYNLFLYGYWNIVVNIESIKTKVTKKFEFFDEHRHPSNPVDGSYNREYWFRNDEEGIMAVFFMKMETKNVCSLF